MTSIFFSPPSDALCRAYNLGGAYRLVMSKPLNVEWEFLRYDDPTLSLFPSDRDRLRNAVEPIPRAQAEGKNGDDVGILIPPSYSGAISALFLHRSTRGSG